MVKKIDFTACLCAYFEAGKRSLLSVLTKEINEKACACFQNDLPLDVTKRKPASLNLKLIGMPSMEDFNRPALTVAISGFSTSDTSVFGFAVNFNSATTGRGLVKTKKI